MSNVLSMHKILCLSLPSINVCNNIVIVDGECSAREYMYVVSDWHNVWDMIVGGSNSWARYCNGRVHGVPCVLLVVHLHDIVHY